jgi:hypothetical protein
VTNNPKNRQQWIFDLLKVESLSYGDCYSKYSPIFSKTERTFNEDWKKATARLSEYQNKANKAKEIASIGEEVQALKIGLKSKIERQLELQAMLEPDFKAKDFVSYDFREKEPIIIERPLTPTEIRNIHIELSKMDGSYAPSKIAETDVSGKDRKLPTGAKILYLGVDELEDNEVNG